METRRMQRWRLIFLVFAGAIELVLLIIGGVKLVEFTNSAEFCGALCHRVMEPEYTAYQASPHAHVACVDCHVGSGASYFVQAKLSGVPMIFRTLFSKYERPITTPVEYLRPARESCELCHWPEKFSGDLVRTSRHYLEDENNTEQVSAMVFKVGGGQFDTARDIHWHIGAEVWYLASDEKRQEIVWVGVVESDGSLTEYLASSEAEISPQTIQENKRLMDCIDCHNRATHIFYSPEELIDEAIAQGRIDSSLPYIKREGMSALGSPSTSLEQTERNIESIEEFYATSYPEVYAGKKALIDQAIAELKEIAQLTTFPEMEVNWQTHSDNISHQGCFRCHGKLVGTAGVQEGKAIDISCDLCHYSL